MWPAFGDANDDGFPFSTYPMFSHPKKQSGLVLTQVLAVYPDGRKVPLPPQISTGNQEVIQAMGTILRESYKKKRAKAFCEDIVRRMQASDDPEWEDVASVEIARSQFDTVAYFQTGPEPVRRRTVRRCPVNAP